MYLRCSNRHGWLWFFVHCGRFIQMQSAFVMWAFIFAKQFVARLPDDNFNVSYFNRFITMVHSLHCLFFAAVAAFFFKKEEPIKMFNIECLCVEYLCSGPNRCMKRKKIKESKKEGLYEWTWCLSEPSARKLPTHSHTLTLSLCLFASRIS